MSKLLLESFEAEIVAFVTVVAVASPRTDVDALSRRSDLMKKTRLDFVFVSSLEQVVRRVDGDGGQDLRRRRVVVWRQAASATSESRPERSRLEKFVFASAGRSTSMFLSGVVKLLQMILKHNLIIKRHDHDRC